MSRMPQMESKVLKRKENKTPKNFSPIICGGQKHQEIRILRSKTDQTMISVTWLHPFSQTSTLDTRVLTFT